MTNSKKECRNKACRKWGRTEDMVKLPRGGYVCDCDCAMAIITKKREKEQERAKKQKIWQKKQDRKFDKYWKEKKKELMSRSQWYNKLQSLVNQYVTKVRDIDCFCFTCKTTNQTIKYDAGHCFTRKARPDIRFDLHNIHKQCSVQCNQHGSGMRAEYKEAIAEKYGPDELARLELEGKSLKEQFPTWQDIEKEIIRYRKLLRDNGIKPNV